MELKVYETAKGFHLYIVPNLPCGVESHEGGDFYNSLFKVPNLPCGVESCLFHKHLLHSVLGFLIYRVELKVKLDFDLYPREPKEFLIYRVELKDAF